MITMVDMYLATEMFEFNALLLHYYLHMYTTTDGLVIYAKARAFKPKAAGQGHKFKTQNEYALHIRHYMWMYFVT